MNLETESNLQLAIVISIYFNFVRDRARNMFKTGETSSELANAANLQVQLNLQDKSCFFN